LAKLEEILLDKNDLLRHPCSKEREIVRLEAAVYGANGDSGMRTDIALIKMKLESMPSATAMKIYLVCGGGLGVIGGLGLKYFLGV
jgi:hypothetical protein